MRKGVNDEEMKAKLGRVLGTYLYNVLIVTNDWCEEEKRKDII